MSSTNTITEPDWNPPIFRRNSSHHDVNESSCWSRYIHVVYQMANEAQLQGHNERSGACLLLKWHLMGWGVVRTLGCHCPSPYEGKQREGIKDATDLAVCNDKCCTLTQLTKLSAAGKSHFWSKEGWDKRACMHWLHWIVYSNYLMMNNAEKTMKKKKKKSDTRNTHILLFRFNSMQTENARLDLRNAHHDTQFDLVKLDFFQFDWHILARCWQGVNASISPLRNVYSYQATWTFCSMWQCQLKGLWNYIVFSHLFPCHI